MLNYMTQKTLQAAHAREACESVSPLCYTHQALLYQQYSTSGPFLLQNPGQVHFLEEGQKKKLRDLFSACKKNIYLRLLPFKHLLNSIFYRKSCVTEGKAKEKSESKAANSILGCIKSVTRRVSVTQH